MIDTARAGAIAERDSARVADGFGDELTTIEIELCQLQLADTAAAAEQRRQHPRPA